MGDSIYVISNSRIVKCIVDEIIVHQTREKDIIKYVVRPYGMKDFVTLDPERMLSSLDEAKFKLSQEVYKKFEEDKLYLDNIVEEYFNSREEEFQAQKEGVK
jgi:uncharacterized protein YpmS